MSIKAKLSGVWTLKSCRSATIDGREIPSVWGDKPAGHLVYTPGGHMAVHVLRTDRIKFEGNDARTGSTEEVRSAFEGYNAYFGTYEVDEKQGIVTHFVERDLIPNFDGDQLTRYFTLKENELRLKTPPYTLCGEVSVSELVWQKIESLK